MKDTESREDTGARISLSSKKRLPALIMSTKIVPIAAGLILVLIFIALSMTLNGSKSTRTESYKDISGAAGLQATINYDAICDRQPCEPTYDFNVYIYKDDGQQVNVIRPDKEGEVNAALAEGNYIMLIGKQFGKDKLFPQEPLALKNGQTLELKLHYK